MIIKDELEHKPFLQRSTCQARDQKACQKRRALQADMLQKYNRLKPFEVTLSTERLLKLLHNNSPYLPIIDLE